MVTEILNWIVRYWDFYNNYQSVFSKITKKKTKKQKNKKNRDLLLTKHLWNIKLPHFLDLVFSYFLLLTPGEFSESTKLLLFPQNILAFKRHPFVHFLIVPPESGIRFVNVSQIIICATFTNTISKKCPKQPKLVVFDQSRKAIF